MGQPAAGGKGGGRNGAETAGAGRGWRRLPNPADAAMIRAMSDPRLHPELFIRLFLSPDAMLGPGKAQLLERIAETGSISAAGREMGMSYKRAWMLVETMNAMFRAPLVESARGGPGGGGAALTDTGRQVLALYRQVEADAAAAAAPAIRSLRELIASRA